MSQKINFAILGAGNIAADMAKAINGISDRITLYAVASRNLEKARLFAEKWNVLKAYGSYEELASDDKVDLIYIATPHSHHYSNAMLCVKNGRNCLVEKAFCANLKQAESLINEAKKQGVFIAEAMWTRYMPSVKLIKSILDSGTIGDISTLEADFSINARGVRRLEEPELCGGALLDLGVYSLTMPDLFLEGDITSVKVTSTPNELGVDLKNEITYVYENGIMSRVKSSFGSELSNYCKITGDKGYLLFAPINAPEFYEIHDTDGRLIKKENISMLVNGYEYEALESAASILEGRKEAPSMPYSKTLKMMAIMDSIRAEMGVKYPFEEKEDFTHKDKEVWGHDDIYDRTDVWDRSNTTSYLRIYDLDTGEITTVGTFDKVIEAPNWSHDGNYLVYNSEGLIYRFDLKTGTSVQIPSGNLKTMNNDHVLSCDDSDISVSDETLDGRSRIYRIPLGQLSDIKEEAPVLITGLAPSYLHGQTPDKEKFCYCAERNGEYDIYTILSDGSEETRLTVSPGLNDGAEYDSKGEYIYFNSVRTGLMQAWRMKSDGTEQTQLTFDKNFNTWFPHISPDRTKIVMVSYYRGELWPGDHVPNKWVELRLMNSDLTDLKTVARVYGGQGTINVNSWSPDSRKFAFVSYKKNK